MPKVPRIAGGHLSFNLDAAGRAGRRRQVYTGGVEHFDHDGRGDGNQVWYRGGRRRLALPAGRCSAATIDVTGVGNGQQAHEHHTR
jgi:hypothetical protein